MSKADAEVSLRQAIGHTHTAQGFLERIAGNDECLQRSLRLMDQAITEIRDYAWSQEITIRESMRT